LRAKFLRALCVITAHEGGTFRAQKSARRRSLPCTQERSKAAKLAPYWRQFFVPNDVTLDTFWAPISGAFCVPFWPPKWTPFQHQFWTPNPIPHDTNSGHIFGEFLVESQTTNKKLPGCGALNPWVPCANPPRSRYFDTFRKFPKNTPTSNVHNSAGSNRHELKLHQLIELNEARRMVKGRVLGSRFRGVGGRNQI
jgi:hypothetical protein